MGDAQIPPQPGWYPDPSGGPRRRYWDGKQWGPHEPAPPAGTAKSSNVWIWIGAAVALFVGIVIVASLVGGSGADDDRPTASTSNSDRDEFPVIETADPPTTTRAPAYTPVPTDFSIDVIVTEQKCFGSAGCNYEFTIDPNYVGMQSIDESERFLVVYEILGGEDPQTGNLRVTDGQINYDTTSRISGPQGATLTARVLQVVKQ